jgi:ABC-type Fe3+-hydroxamate transport system substrate-binding protein
VKEFVDQMNNTIRLSEVPRRIVSLVPSQTELLFDLGLGERVVGITKFCIHPNEWFKSKRRIGGTKDVDFEKVKELEPDLIIGNKEENDKGNIESLSSIAPIWMSDIYTLEDSLNMMLQLGEILEVQNKSTEMVNSIQVNFDLFKNQSTSFFKNRPTVLYLIWRNPFLSAGKNTFIDDLLSRCGFVNFIDEERYPEISHQKEKCPDYIFLSSEPYPFKELHIQELQTLYPTSIIKLVDGEMFSWYGSRLLKSTDYFSDLVKNLHKKR